MSVASKPYHRFPLVSPAASPPGFLVGKWLLEFKPDQVVLPRDKEGTAAALLKEAGVEIKLAENVKVKTQVK